MQEVEQRRSSCRESSFHHLTGETILGELTEVLT
jgi:hypothetical protein